jgi:hypothetical protein
MAVWLSRELIYSAIVFVPQSYCEIDVLKEQRVCIKFCQKLGKTATETYEMLTKHSEKQRSVGPRHLSGIPNLKMAARPSTMIRTQAGHNDANQWDC